MHLFKFGVIVAVAHCSVALSQVAVAQGLTAQQRMERMQQIRAIEAQRQEFNRREARARVIERGLVATQRAGDIASVGVPLNKWRGIPGMSNGRWVREYGPRAVRDYVPGAVRDGVIVYGANRVLQNPRVNDYNYRMWRRLQVVQ